MPLRVEIGPKDVQAGQVTVVARQELAGLARKEAIPEAQAIATIPDRLTRYQHALLEGARARREASTHRGITDYARFREIIEGDGGFVFAGWCGSADCETRVKEETKATIRVLPDPEFRSPEAPRNCLVCGGAAVHEAVWARAY